MKTNEIKLLVDECFPLHDERIKQIPNTSAEEILEDVVCRVDCERILNIAKDILPERSYQILLRRYGFYDGCAWTLERIGKEMNVSGYRIHQINDKSLRVLRYYLKSMR